MTNIIDIINRKWFLKKSHFLSHKWESYALQNQPILTFCAAAKSLKREDIFSINKNHFSRTTYLQINWLHCTKNEVIH